MRKRFTHEEREAFQPGTAVEWRNVSHWHAATVISAPEQGQDGWWFVKLTNHATTRTVSAGELITGAPGAVRLPQSTTSRVVRSRAVNRTAQLHGKGTTMAYSLERHQLSGTVYVFRDGEYIGHFWPDPKSNGFAAFVVDRSKPIARPKTERTCVLKITDGKWDGAGAL